MTKRSGRTIAFNGGKQDPNSAPKAFDRLLQRAGYAADATTGRLTCHTLRVNRPKTK